MVIFIVLKEGLNLSVGHRPGIHPVSWHVIMLVGVKGFYDLQHDVVVAGYSYQ